MGALVHREMAGAQIRKDSPSTREEAYYLTNQIEESLGLEAMTIWTMILRLKIIPVWINLTAIAKRVQADCQGFLPKESWMLRTVRQQNQQIRKMKTCFQCQNYHNRHRHRLKNFQIRSSIRVLCHLSPSRTSPALRLSSWEANLFV